MHYTIHDPCIIQYIIHALYNTWTVWYQLRGVYCSYKLHVEALLIKEDFQTTIDTLKPAIDAVILTARGNTSSSSSSSSAAAASASLRAVLLELRKLFSDGPQHKTTLMITCSERVLVVMWCVYNARLRASKTRM